MKRRWAAATVRDGLTRESAAWFVQPAMVADAGLDRADDARLDRADDARLDRADDARLDRADDTGLKRTLAAAVFLALAPATRTRLAAATGAGAYREFFARAEDLLPALLLFFDEPTGQEIWHRYVWPGPPAPGTTYPYTKVARAGRQVGFTGRRVHVVTVDPPMLAHAELLAEAGCGPGGPAGPMVCAGPSTELARLAAGAGEPAIPPGEASGKLHRVCAHLADPIAARMRSRGAWPRGTWLRGAWPRGQGLAGGPP